MKIKYIYSGIRGVLKYEGIKVLLSRGSEFLSHQFLIFKDYYVVVTIFKDVDKEIESDYLPKIDEHCYRIISTNQEVDKLISDGLDLGAYELNLRIFMDKGAKSFCHFVGKVLAHFTFLADNPRGKEAVDSLLCNVDFEKGYIIAGRSLTVPKYRRLHIRNYNGYITRKHYWDMGKVGCAFTVQTNNYPALSSVTKQPNQMVVSRCRYIKILWFKYFKEVKMDPITMKEMLEQKPEYIKKKK